MIKLNNNKDNKNNIHNYGNIIVDKKPLHKNTLRKLDVFKEELNNLDLDKQTKNRNIFQYKKDI